MVKRRILITGGSGFLGWHLAFHLREKHEIWATYLSHPFTMDGVMTIRMNITDKNEVANRFEEIRPDAVIHAAALTDVDRCEVEKKVAFITNVTGTVNVLGAAAGIGAFLIYTSTDLVFGEEKRMYSEEDIPSPTNYYGQTKLEGEKKIAANDSALTLRMALMYGSDTGIKGSFLSWMKKGLEIGDSVRLYTDQYRTPLYVGDAALAVEAVLMASVKKHLYHIAGPQRINRYDFGRIYAEIFDHDPALLMPVRMDDVPSKARRSRDCSLSIESARMDLAFKPMGVREGLLSLKKSLSG